ncbi:Htp1, partial [Symbiodinium microadriaticum]
VLTMLYLTILAALLACASAQVTDLQLSGASVSYIWLESGFVYIDDRQWYPISTVTSQFTKATSVFISLPDQGGTLYDSPSNVFLAPRVKNRMTQSDNKRTFSVKLQQANDSFCSKQWRIPQYLTDKVQVSWMVVQRGAYEISGGHQFIIGEGNMTRADGSSTATVANGNAIRLWFPENCMGVAGSCTHSGTDSNRGAVAQLQTDNNQIDNGREFFLYIRIRVVFSRHIQLVLIPHSSIASSIFTVTTPEIGAYIVFDTPLNIRCLEKAVFETAIFFPVTSTARFINYQNTYLYPPGLYGGLSTVSLVDATVLRQFSNGINSGNFITQEDQCAEEQTIHTAEETAYIIVLGEIATTPTTECKVSFGGVETFSPTHTPTGDPTRMPTPVPTRTPTTTPTRSPTSAPSPVPSATPTRAPTRSPTNAPTFSPTRNPTVAPTNAPTHNPTVNPTTAAPTGQCAGTELEATFRKTSSP